MSLPELDVARVRKFVQSRNDGMPSAASDLVRYELDVEPGALTIRECRPPWRPEYGPEWTRHAIARLRYVKSRKEWTLYWRDSHEKFHLYDRARPTANVQTLLDEISEDPTSIFWG